MKRDTDPRLANLRIWKLVSRSQLKNEKDLQHIKTSSQEEQNERDVIDRSTYPGERVLTAVAWVWAGFSTTKIQHRMWWISTSESMHLKLTLLIRKEGLQKWNDSCGNFLRSSMCSTVTNPHILQYNLFMYLARW